MVVVDPRRPSTRSDHRYSKQYSKQTPPVAHIQRIRVNHYVAADGRRCTKSTPGARKVESETACYYLFDGGRRVRKLYADRRASNKALTDYETAKERGEAGLSDGFSRHRDTPAGELAERYLAGFLADSGNKKYQQETARLLRAMVGVVAPGPLVTLTPEAVNSYLGMLLAAGKAPNMRKKYHSAMSGFCRWLFENGYTRENLILRVPIPRGGVLAASKYRSLTPNELRRLFRTARRRPLEDAQRIRRGPRKGELGAKVRPGVRSRLELEGRERALVYRTAALTGLRRSELARLRVRHLRRLRGLPYPILDVPAEATKNKQAVRLWLLPKLFKRIRRWVGDTARGPDDPLFRVPSKRVFVRDRTAAGIAEFDSRGKASFHSLRKSANVLLRKADVPVNKRRLFMRHSDIRLTDSTYDDATLLDLKELVPALEKYELA